MKWTYKYKENTIVVNNGISTDLFVNDQLQDRKNGISFSAELKGKLVSGEEIKVSIGGILNLTCSLFIDNVLQTPIE